MNKEMNWDQLLEEFDQSICHESIQAFCSRKHIQVAELKKHFNAQHKNSTLVDFKAGQKKNTPTYMIIDVNGMKLRIGKDFDREHLADVLKVMKSIC